VKRILVALLGAVSVVVSMPQLNGWIAGRILHPDGTPVIGMRVVAIEVGSGETTLLRSIPASRITRTDSAGRYRMEAASGSYYVAAGREGYGSGGFGINSAEYFPGTDKLYATAITVRPGVTSEAEFRLATPSISPSFKVTGRVVGDLSNLRSNAEGHFTVNLRPLSPTRAVGIAPEQVFELRNVPPGTYTVTFAFQASDAARVILQGIIDVDKDITDLTFDVSQRTVTVLGQAARPVPRIPVLR
jgi:hypothetical protein